MLGLGIGATKALHRRRDASSNKVTITPVVRPESVALVVGQSLNDTPNWAAFSDPANYTTSVEGETIAGALIEMALFS